jgi:glucose/mannose transport system permease protein
MTAATSSGGIPEVAARQAAGRRPRHVTIGRIGIYAFLAMSAIFFLLPLWVMIVTSFKDMPELRTSSMLALPVKPTIRPWIDAWMRACNGIHCDGIRGGFLNSFRILVPSVICTTVLGAVNGYAMSLWRVRGADLLFAGLLIGAFIPVQVFIYPLYRIFATIGLNASVPGIVVAHIIFQMPVITLIFRNYFTAIPIEIFKAARIDGAGFWRIFLSIMLPMSAPIVVVAVILLTTNIWNDFILGLVFAGRVNHPMTVMLNNLVISDEGAQQDYAVMMAAVFLTTLVPLFIFFVSGRWFVRGIAAGAVKG